MKRTLRFCSKIIAVPAFLLAASFTQAATNTWLPLSGTNDWFVGTNWSGGSVPTNGDEVVINPGATTNWVMLTNSTYELASILLTNKCRLVFSNWDTKLSATNVDIMTNAVVTLPGAFTNTPGASNNIYIFCSNLTIGAGGSINANAAGFIGRPGPSSGYGPGGGYSWDGGGGYGGYGGGANGGTNYGDPAAPLQPGSAGGALLGTTVGGSGGGAVRIQASGTVTLNGIITANGGSGANNYACGSGGAIYITCLSLAGTGGVLRANGGSGTGASAGGGGGRIAVIYDTNAQASIPSVLFETRGEIGGYADGYSGAGTLYFPNNLFLTETFQHSGNWAVPGFTNWSPGSLLISNGWLGLPAYGFQLTVSNNLTILGTNVAQHRLALTNEAVLVTCGGNLFLTNAALELIDRRVPPRPSFQERIVSGPTLTVGSNLTLTNSAVIYVSCGATSGPPANSWGGLVTVTGDVFVATNATVYLYSHPTNGGSPLIRLRNLTLNGAINANSAGFKGRPGLSRGYGPGGGYSWDGGGGYGGAGGGSTNAGVTYGDSNAPIQPGSAGGALSGQTGGNGGGAVRIQASATIMLNGTITANGGNGANNYACGSGGGIYITCRSLTGTGGVLRANGGSGAGASAGGGGGRIAVWRMYDVSAGAISNSVSRGTGSGTEATNGTVVWGWIPVPGTVFTIH